jgi:predicted transcriptional regulator
MDTLCNLLFELSSSDRIKILQELNRKASNVTKLSKMLDLTTQETSRQVHRLKEAGLIRKNSVGFYNLTLYAELVLKHLEGINFLSQHKDYFKTHSLTHIPDELILRIGDLTEAEYLSSVSQSFYSVEKLVKEAESYVWLVNDQMPFSVVHELGKSLERGTKHKAIQTKYFVYPSCQVREIFQLYDKTVLPTIWHSRRTGALENRLDDPVDVFLFISEKQATIGFPLKSGEFDYQVFSSSGKRFHRWCKGVFSYCWEKATPMKTVVKEPCEWAMDHPEVPEALETILKGGKAILRKDLASELEKRRLTSRGNITRLGYYVRSHLQFHAF